MASRWVPTQTANNLPRLWPNLDKCKWLLKCWHWCSSSWCSSNRCNNSRCNSSRTQVLSSYRWRPPRSLIKCLASSRAPPIGNVRLMRVAPCQPPRSATGIGAATVGLVAVKRSTVRTMQRSWAGYKMLIIALSVKTVRKSSKRTRLVPSGAPVVLFSLFLRVTVRSCFSSYHRELLWKHTSIFPFQT